MSDALLNYLRQTLPPEVASLSLPYVEKLERGEYESVLQDPEAQTLFGVSGNSKAEELSLDDFPSWNDFIFHRLGEFQADRSKPEKQYIFFCIGYAALLSFLQSTVTGPSLNFSSAKSLLTRDVAESSEKTKTLRQALLESLGMDGIAAYSLTPNVELLCLADAVVTCPPILKNVKAARWAKLRVEFVQQRLLSEVSASLQGVIYDDLQLLEESLLGEIKEHRLSGDGEAEFLLERATIHIHHGLDILAQKDLEKAKNKRNFQFALTGILGKRTKYQEKDTSQLVVLAKSNKTHGNDSHGDGEDAMQSSESMLGANGTAPTRLDLDDDTLLESISFAQGSANSAQVIEQNNLPSSLASLDPSKLPQLEPLDSTILLLLASSITNTAPQHGLTREETLPYATRVLEGGSANWQVYTQALLMRSRIEGYSSRTVERGLLQLQALVDQVIADTSVVERFSDSNVSDNHATSFLPKSKEGESASVTDRLRYIFQLASPSRWELEAELAARWVQLGGLRSALDIYERLEMWAEAALCWAATEREDKARIVVRRQLFLPTDGRSHKVEKEVVEGETWSGPPRDPPPLDAPRLYCILGDIDQSPLIYEKAWEVSNQRFGRAQRSLGRYYFANKDFVKAADAYSKSLRANQLNQSSWFALGCTYLELTQFGKAVEAFSRCVQLDESDAEAWSNLAAALLRRGSDNASNIDGDSKDLGSDVDESKIQDESEGIGHERRRDALNALKRAASLKHDSYRIWENVLIVAASCSPPDFTSILAAQKRIIELRGPSEGERCIDAEILDLLVQHVISLRDQYDPDQPGLPRMVVRFVDQNVTPLITASSDLWRLISKVALWRNKPSLALNAEEKSWRAITSQLGWETESERRWNAVVEATVRLCDAYESLGAREMSEGMSAGAPVAKDWKFKARSAVRGTLGRGKGSWEGTRGWERLREVMEGLKG